MKETDPAKIPLQEYLEAHTKPNGGWRSFLHSNLFTALVIWMLSQAVLVGGVIVTIYLKMSSLTEWKGGVNTTLKRMDDQGTAHSHWTDEQQGQELVKLRTEMDKVKDDSAQFKVIQSEHRRLTRDVEKLLDEREKR